MLVCLGCYAAGLVGAWGSLAWFDGGVWLDVCSNNINTSVQTYRVIGEIGPPGWGPNAQKGLDRREFWGLGSIPAKTGTGGRLGMILQLWMTARAYPPDEKVCGGFEPVSNVSCEKNHAKNTIDRIGPPPFSRIFNGWQSLLAAVTLTAFDSRGSRPSVPLRRSVGQIDAGLGPFASKGLSPRWVFVFVEKHVF